MSKFLGKIHYWLFSKVRYAEQLEEELETFAFEQGILEAAQWKSEILSKFGMPAGEEPLENIIDTTNIHGWLQEKIIGVESRQAAWITRLINLNSSYKNAIISIFEQDGTEKGSTAKEQYAVNSTSDMYKVLNDFILEGMPCDAVDSVVENEENSFVWVSTRCLHRQNWDAVEGNIEIFYELRSSWIKSFVRAFDDAYNYDVEYDGEKRINSIKK